MSNNTNNPTTHLPRRLLRSASTTTASALPPDHHQPPVTRSRFGFTPSAATTATATASHTHNPIPPKNEYTNQTSARPSSALARPSSSLARPSTALGRPATALGTRSQTRLPQSTTIAAPNRKRRTSSASSKRPARPSSHGADPPSDTIPLHSDLKNQLEEALEKLVSVQAERDRFKLLSEEATLQADQLRANEDNLRSSFDQEIQRLRAEHGERVEEIQKDLGRQLTCSHEQVASIQSESDTRLGELDRATAQISSLLSEVEQMDVESGHHAAQMIELTRVKTELEAKLEATRKELDESKQENQNRIEQVTQHYHHIQSKLHQDLEQITADYQACLQQQSLTATPPSEIIVDQFNSKVQQLEQKLLSSDLECQRVKSELHLLIEATARHQEEKLAWHLSRDKLQEEIHQLKLQADMVKRRKISSIKTEQDSSKTEDQVMDMNMKKEEEDGDESTISEKKVSSLKNNVCPTIYEEDRLAESKDVETEGITSLKKELNLAQKTITQLKEEQTLLENKLNSVNNHLAAYQLGQTEVTSLKNELKLAQETIVQLKEEQTLLENELNSTRNHLVSSRQTNEDLKSTVVDKEIHQSVQNDLKYLQEKLSDLTAELDSSRETIRTLEVNFNALKNDQAHELDRLSQVHASEIQSSGEEITRLKTELDDLKILYTQTLSSSQDTIHALNANIDALKVSHGQELASVSESHAKEIQSSAEQIIQLKTALDDVQRHYAEACSKLQDLEAFSPERVSVLTTRLREERDEAQSVIEFMRVEQKAIEEAGREAISALQIKQQKTLDETVSERNSLVVTVLMLYRAIQSWKQTSSLAKSSGLVSGQLENKSVKPDDSLVNFNSVLFNCSFGNTNENSFLKGNHQSDFESHFGSETNAQAYATALEQITTLTQQVQDLKEQLLRTYVAHEDQEKQILADLETSQRENMLLKEQHAQIQNQQTNLISSLELKFAGIQHQFQTLEVSYNSLSEEKVQLTLSLKEQKQVIETLEEQLVVANSLQKDALITIERSEESLRLEESKRLNESEQNQAEIALLKEELEKSSANLSNLLDEKSKIIVQLQEEVGVLTARIQEDHQKHERYHAQLENELSELVQERKVIDKEHHLLQLREANLEEKFQVSELEIENLLNESETAKAEHQAFKDKVLEELGRTKEELVEVTQSKDSISHQFESINEKFRVLTEELQSVKSQQGVDNKSDEQYQTLLGECQVLKDQLSTVTNEVETLRSQYVDMTTSKEELTAEVKEKDVMINSLKADLATVSKLHNRLSSSTDTTTDRIKDLETRIESKSLEAEEAMDRLLDEMQKNKRLSIMVETLKIKLKSKTKPAISLDPPIAAATGDDQNIGAVAGGSSTHEETECPSTGSNTRKRKHDQSSSSNLLRLGIEMGDDQDRNMNKENPSSTTHLRSIRRKISTSTTKPTVLITEPEDPQQQQEEEGDKKNIHHLAILQPISVNQPSSTISYDATNTKHHTSSSESKSDLKPSVNLNQSKLALASGPAPPTVKTNSNLLASIQSLRRKQQLKHSSSLNSLNSNNKSVGVVVNPLPNASSNRPSDSST